MKAISDSEFIRVFKYLHEHLLTKGIIPSHMRLENESSQALQSELKYKYIDVQLAPPRMHPRNASELAIRTFKNHFIAELCSTDPDFLM